MNAWKIILATMVIFGTGVVTGGLLVRHSQRAPRHPPQQTWMRPMPAPSAGGLRIEFLRRAERELDLDPVQRQRIERLLKESQDRTRKLMEPVSPHLRAELQRTREDFRAILNSEQRAKFDEMVKQHQQRPPREPRNPVPRDRVLPPETPPAR